MSCRQSKQVIRSKSRPAKSCARPTSKLHVRHPVRPCVRGRGGDRGRVEVVADELGIGERLRHQDRRQAVPAADIGDLRARLQLVGNAVERRKPLLHERIHVARPEQPRHGAEHAAGLVAPGDAARRS